MHLRYWTIKKKNIKQSKNKQNKQNKTTKTNKTKNKENRWETSNSFFKEMHAFKSGPIWGKIGEKAEK